MSNSQVNYKQKYEELKMKFMEAVDQAFRIGFEQGAVQGMQDAQMQQQQMQAEQQAQAQGGIGQGQGSEGSPAGAEQMANPNGGSVGDMEPDSENPAGSELDQHIAKLESMVSKAEASPTDLAKAISELQSLRKAEAAKITFNREMKKSQAAVPGIVKALHKPAFKLGVQASHNMNSNAKQAVGMQAKIVEDIMKSWEEEEKSATSDIQKILNTVQNKG
jgi:hypothetical protein